MSNFLFGPFSILSNFPYKSVRYLELCYLELSLCRTIFSAPSVIFGLFPIRYLEHSNKVFKWIILFISGIRILITALAKLYSEVCPFFFSTPFRKHVLIQVKTQCKKFRQEISGFERARKRSLQRRRRWKMVEDGMEIFDDLVVKPSSIEITNALNTLQNLCLFHKVGNDMLELLQRFESSHLYNAARKQSSILTYFNRK